MGPNTVCLELFLAQWVPAQLHDGGDMARTKAVLGAGARLSDYLSASLLARVFPPDAVHDVLNEHGRNSQRVRRFPAVAEIYYCMALSL